MTTLAEGLDGRLGRQLPAIVLTAAVVGVLYSLGSAVWFFLGGAETDLAPLAPTAANAEDAPRPEALDAEAIAQLNLFGRPVAEDARERLADAPETRLQLKLEGVFLAEPRTESSVIVAERNRDGKLYRIGDRLPGNAELLEVFADRIVLSRAGRREILKFVDASPGGLQSTSSAAGARAASAAGRRTANRTSAPTTTDGGAGQSAGADGSTPGRSSRSTASADDDDLGARLSAFSERLNVDPDGALAEIGVTPVANGASQGYRLGSEVPAATLAQVGLRSGDVVLSVNGRAVGDIQQDRGQLESIVDAGSARLEILRGDRRFFVTTRIR